MKEWTNITHNKPIDNIECQLKLQKEYWGTDEEHISKWHLSCMVCGFSKIVKDEMFLKWQYCDRVNYD